MSIADTTAPTADAAAERRKDARRLADGFIDFLANAKPDHKALFDPVIDFWRSHFPDGDGAPGVRKLEMAPVVEGKIKAAQAGGAITNVRSHVHEDGHGFTAMWEQSMTAGGAGLPVCMVCTVKDGRISRFDEYVDAHNMPKH